MALTKMHYTGEIATSCVWNCQISDVDECSIEENNCQQLCNNLPGTYNCSCYTGFMLNNDNITCSGRNLEHVIYFDLRLLLMINILVFQKHKNTLVLLV